MLLYVFAEKFVHVSSSFCKIHLMIYQFRAKQLVTLVETWFTLNVMLLKQMGWWRNEQSDALVDRDFCDAGHDGK